MTGAWCKPSTVLIVLAALVLGGGISGCGGASGSKLRHVSASTAARGPFRGDEDDDDQESRSWGKTSLSDADDDRDNDRADNAGLGYRDHDDSAIAQFGHSAAPSQAQSIKSIVGRYLTAIAARDGQSACSSLIYSTVVEAIPEDYGHGSAGPAYLSSATTCPAVMKLVFSHTGEEFKAPFKITGVRIGGKRAYALLGSPLRPADYISLQSEIGHWKVDALLPVRMP